MAMIVAAHNQSAIRENDYILESLVTLVTSVRSSCKSASVTKTKDAFTVGSRDILSSPT